MLQAIARFFKNLFNSPALIAFEAWCKEVFTAEKALVLSAIKAFAIEAVATAEATGLDNSTKRQMAFSQIGLKAQTAGIVVGASMIALALEMAVQAMKGKSNG